MGVAGCVEDEHVGAHRGAAGRCPSAAGPALHPGWRPGRPPRRSSASRGRRARCAAACLSCTRTRGCSRSPVRRSRRRRAGAGRPGSRVGRAGGELDGRQQGRDRCRGRQRVDVRVVEEGAVAGGIVRVLGRDDVRPEERGLRRGRAAQAQCPSRVRDRQPVARLAFQRGRPGLMSLVVGAGSSLGVGDPLVGGFGGQVWSVVARWMVQAVSRASWGVPAVNPVSRVVSW